MNTSVKLVHSRCVSDAFTIVTTVITSFKLTTCVSHLAATLQVDIAVILKNNITDLSKTMLNARKLTEES